MVPTSSSASYNHPNESSSVWSSPNIGQMTETSQDWYKKMMNDSAELIKISFQPEYQELDFSYFITQSQPASIQEVDTTMFPFNSLPNVSDFDTSNFFDTFTPETSEITSSILQSSSSRISPKKTNYSGVVHISRGRKYHNTNLLAQYCQEVLNLTAHPTMSQIGDIVEKLKTSGGPNYDSTEKKLRSSVREWFRKRREYMATKIYKSCKRLLPSCPHKTKQCEKMTNFLKKIHSNSALVGIIILEAKLPMQSEKEKIEFVKEKITDFYLKYPQRKLRNTNGIKFIVDMNEEFDMDGDESNLSQDAMEEFINNS